MLIRFGYVAMSVLLEDASPSKSVTLKNYQQIAAQDPEAAIDKVRRVTRDNLANTTRILKHNIIYGVSLYRFSSKIFPLATHPLLSCWNYLDEMRPELIAIGEMIRENGMRVSFHPDHFTLLNSPREEVLQASLIDFQHHDAMLEAMGLDQRAKLVTHIGGGYNDKEKSMERFCTNLKRVPPAVAQRLTLENDDRIFTAADVLNLCQDLALPMVLDLHHHLCNRCEEKLEDILGSIFSTWRGAGSRPKVHISSPRSEQDCRSHHDFVNPDDLYPFLKLAANFSDRLDVMVEAKQKDRAMFTLVKELGRYPLVRQIGNAALVL